MPKFIESREEHHRKTSQSFLKNLLDGTWNVSKFIESRDNNNKTVQVKKMAEVTMQQMKRISKAVMKGGFPLLIRGRHGIGKSEFVYQCAKEAGDILGEGPSEFPVIEMRASLMTEGDLTGLPYRGPKIGGQDSTKFNPPDWYLNACVAPAILFFDEVDRGISEVRQGIFQINDSRQLNGHKLHPLTRVVACVNGGIHASQYQVGDFDPAELDRYSVYDLEPSVEEWASYCRDNDVLPEIVTFCVEFPKFLEVRDPGALDPSQVTPSRRSWVRLSKTLSSMEEFDGGFTEDNIVFLTIVAQGFIGIEAASAFKSHAVNFKRAVDPEKVIYENQLDCLKDMSVADWTEFVDAFVRSEILARPTEELTEKNFSNVRQVIMAMPTEALILFWQALCQTNKFVPDNIHKLGWDFDNTESEVEQVAFTKKLADCLIDPPEDESIQDLIKKVTDEQEAAKKAAEAAAKKEEPANG